MPQGCAGCFSGADDSRALGGKILGSRVAGRDRGLHCLEGAGWDGGPVEIAKAVGMGQMPNGAFDVEIIRSRVGSRLVAGHVHRRLSHGPAAHDGIEREARLIGGEKMTETLRPTQSPPLCFALPPWRLHPTR